MNRIVTSSPDEKQRLRQYIADACDAVAMSWPMKTIAYRNPLSGCEYLPFGDSIREAKHLLGGSGYAEQQRAAFVPLHVGINLSHFSEACAKVVPLQRKLTES